MVELMWINGIPHDRLFYVVFDCVTAIYYINYINQIITLYLLPFWFQKNLIKIKNNRIYYRRE